MMILTSLPMQMPELKGSSGPPSPLLWVKEGKGTYTQALELETKSVWSPFLKSQPQGRLPSWLSPAAWPCPPQPSTGWAAHWANLFLTETLSSRQSDMQEAPPFFESVISSPEKGLQMCPVSIFHSCFLVFDFLFCYSSHGPFLLLYVKITSLIYTTCLDLRASVRLLGFSAPRAKSPGAGVWLCHCVCWAQAWLWPSSFRRKQLRGLWSMKTGSSVWPSPPGLFSWGIAVSWVSCLRGRSQGEKVAQVGFLM